MHLEEVKRKLVEYKQEHLLEYLDALAGQDELLARFCSELLAADLGALQERFELAREASAASASISSDDLLPPLSEDCGSVSTVAAEQLQQYRERGLHEIGSGHVAVLLLAGGQGTRLGVAYPKGMYDVGLPSRKTLYQLQGERIRRIQQLAEEHTGIQHRAVVPWYIMTSEATKDDTAGFFESHNYFGLRKEDVVIFEQNTLPCLTSEGKLIVESGYRIAKAPDGNGGLYRALKDSKVLDDMLRRGIKYVHAYCVDNILVKMADPVFVGFCLEKNVKCGAKVIEKRIHNEPVGVICRVNHKYRVVEYSEIPPSLAAKRTADGKLKYSAGGICNHFFTVDFLSEAASVYESELQLHVAEKKVPYITADGKPVKPTKPNGIKLEKFVFDVFPFAGRVAVWEVLREEEFSPLKNADGADKDTPTTARKALSDLHRSYVVAAGGRVCKAGIASETSGQDQSHESDHGDVQAAVSGSAQVAPANGLNGSKHIEGDEGADIIVEISPLLSYCGEGLYQYVKGKVLTSPLLLSAENERCHGQQ